jgi:hypothetical protein
MGERITNDGSQRASLIQQTKIEPAGISSDGNVAKQTPAGSIERPVQTVAKEALRRLDSGGVRIVLEGVGAQLEKALGKLASDTPNFAQIASPLKNALKQLESLSSIDEQTKPAWLELSGLAHGLLEAAMKHQGSARQLGDVPARISEVVADLGIRSTLDEIHAANHGQTARVSDLLDILPDASKKMRNLSRMYAGAEAFGGIDQLGGKLDRDIGSMKAEMTRLMSEQKISPQNQAAFFGAFAEVRQAFEVGAAAGDDMQRTNWVHTRVEVLHTLQAAKTMKLSGNETLAAMLGALSSDAFKDAGPFSLLWHNRGGGELVLPLLASRHFPGNQALLDDARNVALEHQITPAVFMSGAMNFMLGPDQPATKEVVAAINNPTDSKRTKNELDFSPEARELMRGKGIPGWATLDPDSRNYRASLAAIMGDVQQYVGFDGFIKIATDLRDPGDARPFMRDQFLKDAVSSSLNFSFGEGMKVIQDPKINEYAQQLKTEQRAVLEDTIYLEVDRRLRSALNLPKQGDIEVSYWTKPAVYGQIGPEERAVIDLVKKTFAQVTAEIGGVPLDPFKHIEAKENAV